MGRRRVSEHGVRRYEAGCRCDECREAKRIDNARYRQRRKESDRIVTYDQCKDCGTEVQPRTNPDIRCAECCQTYNSKRTARRAKRKRLTQIKHTKGTKTWYVNSAGVASSTLNLSITKAFNAGDYTETLNLIRANSLEVDECWLWQGRVKKGYPLLGTAQVHRTSWQAANGTVLARNQPVHHTCSNRECVNPEHLQVVTSQENTAEMLERRWYRERIQNLEEALRFYDPNNELLDEANWK